MGYWFARPTLPLNHCSFLWVISGVTSWFLTINFAGEIKFGGEYQSCCGFTPGKSEEASSGSKHESVGKNRSSISQLLSLGSEAVCPSLKLVLTTDLISDISCKTNWKTQLGGGGAILYYTQDRVWPFSHNTHTDRQKHNKRMLKYKQIEQRPPGHKQQGLLHTEPLPACSQTWSSTHSLLDI